MVIWKELDLWQGISYNFTYSYMCKAPHRALHLGSWLTIRDDLHIGIFANDIHIKTAESWEIPAPFQVCLIWHIFHKLYIFINEIKLNSLGWHLIKAGNHNNMIVCKFCAYISDKWGIWKTIWNVRQYSVHHPYCDKPC